MKALDKEIQFLIDAKIPFEVKYTEDKTELYYLGYVYFYEWKTGAFLRKKQDI